MKFPEAEYRPVEPSPLQEDRLHYLDATRAFALILGIVFHASLSFMPMFIGWAVQDVSTSAVISSFVLISHSFRMELFFLMAGFFGRLAFNRKGPRAFIGSRLLRIAAPLVLGWLLLRPLLVSGWIMGSASMRGEIDVWSGLEEGFRSLLALPAGFLTGSHLWFLYYLLLVTSVALVVRGLVACRPTLHQWIGSRCDAAMGWLAGTRLLLPLLAIPVAGALCFNRFWSMDTPDQTLYPHLPVLAVYSGFFLFGWMLHRQSGLVDRFARLSADRWIIAAGSIAAICLLSPIEADPSHPRYLAARVVFSVCYALTMWCLVFFAIGVFRRLCSKPSALARYVADASYWMYLVHLPIVVWLQIAVAELPWHWSIKWAGISFATIGIALLSYDAVARSTLIGYVLNGRRRPRALRWPARR